MGDRIVGGLDIDTYSDAPLRVSRTVFLDVPPRRVFAIISDSTHLRNWLPLVTQVNINRGHADMRDGVGTIRYLHLGWWYTLREYVIAFDPPHLLASSIEQDALIADHVSVILLEPERYGGTNLTWQHYFRAGTLPFVTGPLLSAGLNLWTLLALRRLSADLGGES
jgi:uncharacterized protein YndB with AHSA1/START domain